MNRYKKLFSNTVILSVGTLGSKLLVFLLMPLYTAWMTTAQYGAAEVITSIANFLISVACVGVSTGIFRFAAGKNADRKEVFSSSIVLLFTGLGVFLLLSPLLLLIDYCRPYLWLIAGYVFFAGIQAVCAQYLRAIDRTTLFAGQGIFNTVVTILFNVLFLAGLHMGVYGYILSVILGNALTAVFLLIRARLWQEFSFSAVRRETVWALLRFSLPMIPTTVCWLITDLSDRSMVTAFCGEDINGIYSAAYKIPTIVNLTAGIFLQAWQFSAVAESEDREVCSRFYESVFSGFLSLVMIGSAFLILFSRFLSALLLRNAFFEAWRYMPTLLCAAALEALVSFFASVYLVQKKSMHSFLTALCGAVGNILLNLLLIPRMGALGAAVATLASYAAVLLLRLWDAPRLLPFRTCRLRMLVGILLLFASAFVMTAEVPGRIVWCTLLTAATVCVNAPALWRGCRGLLSFRKERQK